MLQRAALLLLFCAVPAALAATVIVPAGFGEIVNGAEVIAYGQVIDTTVESSADRKLVSTLVTLRVGTYLKGGPGETIVFRVPGGQVGRFRNVTVGAPQFAVGEEAVVFLNVQGSDRPYVFGLNQGVFRVRTDRQTNRRLVVPPALMARTAASETIVRGAVSRRPVPLETFGAQVQTVMAETAARSRR
jgi:hypothetical protein